MKAEHTIVLIDDNPTFLRHARRFLAQHRELTVLDAAKEPQAGLRQVKTLQPDVVLVDISLPSQSGLDLIPALKSAAPDARVIVVTMQDAAQYQEQAFRRGADGFVPKADMAEALIEEIKRVTDG